MAAVQPVSAADPVFVRAIYSYTGTDTSSLSFHQGEVIEVLSTLESGWWDGVVLDSGTRGWFPSNYTKPIGEEEAMRATAFSAGGDSRRGNVAASSMSRSTSRDNDAFEAGLLEDFGAVRLGGSLARDPTLQDFIGGGEFDLSSFSSGGDIFGEIAAAPSRTKRRRATARLTLSSTLTVGQHTPRRPLPPLHGPTTYPRTRTFGSRR